MTSWLFGKWIIAGVSYAGGLKYSPMWHCVHKAYNFFSIRQYSVSFGILIDYYARQSTYRLSTV